VFVKRGGSFCPSLHSSDLTAARSCPDVIPDAILADLIDYDEFHTGARSESSYTVVETNLQQFMEVPAYALPFTAVGLAGYVNNGGCSCGCGYGASLPDPTRSTPHEIR
jgi:Na+/melibiose symporter-like transporter